jgi:Zn-dependent protease/predicted transcriptional regulator
MRWSLKIAQVAGIGIFVHWTFFLLLAWVVFSYVSAGQSGAVAAEGVVFVLAIFACVVLHELGHALTGRHFGVQTRDITLLPIGGVARLESIPEIPMQEFWIAVAGPAVNVVIAAVLLVFLVGAGELERARNVTLIGGPFLVKLTVVNVMLVLFNLLPAFPMDGGRVLRALLAMRMPRVRATHIAATVGQAMAILFGVVGVFTGQWMLLFIAMFVYLGAQAESHMVEMRSLFKGVRARDAMITRFLTAQPDDSIRSVVEESSASHQKNFPVLNGRAPLGVVLHRDLIAALTKSELAKSDGHARVADIMRRDVLVVQDSDPLDRVIDQMQSLGQPLALVARNGELVGLLSEEHIGQWVMLHSSLGKSQNPRSEDQSRERSPVSLP